MTPTPTLASGAVARTGAGDAGTAVPGAAEPGPYVLNLCSSTTPMALEQTQIPELKRFHFFVSRRREEGRERFRLHMGYFATLEEAQEWLNVVRDIYPGAWAGETPGKKLRERAAAEAAARNPQPPAQPQTTARTLVQPDPSVHRSVASAANAAARVPSSGPPINVPTLQAAVPQDIPVARPANVASAQRTPVAQPARSAQPNTKATHPPVAKPAPSRPQQSAQAASANTNAAVATRPAPPAANASTGASPSRTTVTAKAPAQRAEPPNRPVSAVRNPVSQSSAPLPPRSSSTLAPAALARPPAAAKPVTRAGAKAASKSLPGSNVREVLAALDEPTGETRVMPAPPPPVASPSDEASLTDTQVLRFLEARRDDDVAKSEEEGASGSISLLKPDDTGTRRALKEAVVHNAPVSFAVQLQWSVQPVELEKVPPLAIFSAYTLYTVEGSRDGRKWYGLRLGFFTDAISAKQVAYYVRSEFSSVAVVPVSPQERSRASEDEQRSAGLALPKKARQQPVDEFKLIDMEETPALPARVAPPQAPPKPAASAANKRGARVRAREHRSPQTLEETLEILGAGQLEIDNGSGETLNDSGVRHLRVEVQKNTPFRRLIERLSERVRKP